MKWAYRKVTSLLDDPPFMVSAHGWLAIFWFAVAPLVCVFLADSLPFVVFISVYAVVTGHWSSWQAARVEVKEDQAQASIESIKWRYSSPTTKARTRAARIVTRRVRP